MNFIIVLSYFFTVILAIGSGPTILDFKNPVICSPVVQSKSQKAHIHLYIENIDVNDKAVFDSLRFPVLIFRAIDMVNFTKFVPPKEYYNLYSENKSKLYKDIIDTENVNFKLEPRKEFQFDANKVLNDFITLDNARKEETKHVDVDFIVPESGIYCVYVAPPDDQGIIDLKIPVQFKNEYGNLPYLYYRIYSDLRIIIILSMILFGALFHHILKLIGKDFKNMNRLSIISKGIIFYVLAPSIIVNIFSWICLFIRNNFISSSQASVFASLLVKLSVLTNTCYDFYIKFVFLLFTMGYGVIYYHNGQSRQYRIFPQKQFSRVFGLFISSLVLVFLTTVLDSNDSEIPYLHFSIPTNKGDLDDSFRSLLVAGLSFILGLFTIIWSIAPIVYYFKTKKLIASFPPSGGSESSSTERVVSAFRLSIWIIIGLPFITLLVVVFFGVVDLKHIVRNSLPKSPIPEDEKIVGDARSKFWSYEIVELRAGFLLWLIRAAWISSFVLIISVFFIWVKDNNGLVVDPEANDPIQYAEVSEFDISEEEEE